MDATEIRGCSPEPSSATVSVVYDSFETTVFLSESVKSFCVYVYHQVSPLGLSDALPPLPPAYAGEYPMEIRLTLC